MGVLKPARGRFQRACGGEIQWAKEMGKAKLQGEKNSQDQAKSDKKSHPQHKTSRSRNNGGDVSSNGLEPEHKAESQSGDSAEKNSQPNLAAALADRDRAVAEKTEQFERFQRAQAEFENFRKRLLREKEEALEYAAMGTIESLLPVVDDFERALDTPDIDNTFREGLSLIYQRIFDVFTRVGLKPVETEGVKFNPYCHHALDREPAENDEQDQTICKVYQRGYHFKNRLLRPAMVRVAVKETSEQTNTNQKEAKD